MKKRIVSFLMVVAILAATFPFSELLQMNIANAAGDTITLDDGRVVMLPSGVPRTIKVYGKTYEINKELLVDSGITSVPNLESGIAVYGTPKDISGNDYDLGEYRYLGYDVNSNLYVNPDFRPDADSGRSPSQKSWLKMYDYGLVSKSPWFQENPSQCGKWLQTMVWTRDIERGGKLPKDFAKERGNEWLAEHFHIQNPPGEYTMGTARGWHKNSDGSVWYEVFVMPPVKKINIPKEPASVEADFELLSEAYEYQDVGYKDISTAKNSTIQNRKLTITGPNGYIREIENQIKPVIKLKEGNYVFVLKVENEYGDSDVEIKQIRILKQKAVGLGTSKAIAVINAPDEVPINQSFSVTSEGSFPSAGAKIIQYKWYLGTDEGNLVYDPKFDNKPSINVSYSIEGTRIFRLWISDSAGKEAWSNIAVTNIIDGTIASAVAKIDVPDYGYEGIPFDVSTYGSKVFVDDKEYSLSTGVKEGYATYGISGVSGSEGRRIGPGGGEGIIKNIGDYPVTLVISPKNGSRVKDTDYITILPVPIADLTTNGELKEKRLVELDASETIYREDYPLNFDKTYFVVKDLDTGEAVRINYGESINNDFIRTKPFNSLKIQSIFKRPGNYEIYFYAEDTRGHYDDISIERTIRIDEAPVSNFVIKEKDFRKTDIAKVPVETESKSRSIDEDAIGYIEYSYRYDSDNDGSFDDENWVIVGRTTSNKYTIYLDKKVGKYEIRERFKEKFASETIEEFVTDADRKESILIKIFEIDNKEPITSFIPIRSKEIDILIDSSSAIYNTVKGGINNFENSLINDGAALLRPYTFLEQHNSTNDTLIKIASGTNWAVPNGNYKNGNVYEENDKYFIVKKINRSYDYRDAMIYRKSDLMSFGYVPSDYSIDYLRNDISSHSFGENKRKVLLGNTSFLWSESKLYDIETSTEYFLPVSMGLLYNLAYNSHTAWYLDEDNGYFYYHDINSELWEFNLNTRQFRQVKINNVVVKGYNYAILSSTKERIILTDRQYSIDSNTNNKAKINTVVLDRAFNTIKQNTNYTDLYYKSGYPGNSDFSISNGQGYYSSYYDDVSNKVYIFIEIINRRRTDYEYKTHYRLIRLDAKTGSVDYISPIAIEFEQNDQYTGSTESGRILSKTYIDIKNREDGNFQLSLMRRNYIERNDDFTHVIFNSSGKTINEKRIEASDFTTWQRLRVENMESERFLLIDVTYDDNADNLYIIYDIYTKTVLKSVVDRYDNYSGGYRYNKYITLIKNSDDEFLVVENGVGRIFNATTKTYKDIIGAGIAFGEAVKFGDRIIVGNKILSDTGSQYVSENLPFRFTNYINDPIRTNVRDDSINIGDYFVNFNNDRSLYDYYQYNKGFWKIIDNIRAAKFNNKDRYVVIMENSAISYTESQLNLLINLIKEKNAKVIFFGTASNMTFATRLIASTGGYFRNYNANVTTMLNELANTIKLDNADTSDRARSLYIKKGETISYEKIFADYENDPQHIPSGEKWLYYHNPNYFAVNDGLASFHNTWRTTPITKFDKVGKYTVTFLARDNPVGNDNKFDMYRKWSLGTNTLDIIVYEDSIPEEPYVPPKAVVSVSGDLRENHRVDFQIQTMAGSKAINANSLGIKIKKKAATNTWTDTTLYQPKDKIPTRFVNGKASFSRIFTETGDYKIEISFKDIEGNVITEEAIFTIAKDELPISGFTAEGSSKRNQEGYSVFKISSKAAQTDDDIGSIEYYIEDVRYVEDGDLFIPNGTQYYPLKMYGNEIAISKLGNSNIKQIVTEYYVNGIGLNGEELDQYRNFKVSEAINIISLANEAPEIEYKVTPNIIKVGDNVKHSYEITDDTLGGDYIEYRLVHEPTYFQNHHGLHENHGAITADFIGTLNKKGRYDFYARAADEDGAYSGWVYGGQVIAASEPAADFDLITRPVYNGGENKQMDEAVFSKGSIITIKNKSYNEDYETTIPNHGIKYLKIEYRDVADSSYTTLFESDDMSNYLPEVNLPKIDEIGVYEVRMTVGSPEGFHNTTSKEFTILDLRLEAELEPNKIYASQSYKIKAKLSLDGLGVVAYVTHLGEKSNPLAWVQLDKVNEDGENKYYEAEINTSATLKDGEYTIEVYGMYPFNNEVTQNLKLTVKTPIELRSDIKPDGPEEYTKIIQDNLDDNDYIELPAGEKIRISADVISPVAAEFVKAKPEGEGEVVLVLNDETGKYEGLLNISSTKPDKDYYTLTISTRIPNGNVGENTHRVKILTPINLKPHMPNELIEDTVTKIKAETSKYANKVTVKLFKGESFEESISLTPKSYGNLKEWSYDYEVPIGLPEGTYTAEFTSTTPNGNVEVKSVTFILQSLNLKDLRITNMINHPQHEGKCPILYTEALVDYKTGYYVTFKIDAQGDPDTVVMRISYPGYNKEFNMIKESQNGSDSVWRLEWYADPFAKKGTIINTSVSAQKGETTINFNDKYSWNGDYLKVIGSIESDVRIDQEL